MCLGNALSGQVWRCHTCRIDDLKEVLLWGVGVLCVDGAELREVSRAGASTGERRLWDR